MFDEKSFGERLAKLRFEKGISARDMSLSIGQNPGYINTIENGKAYPSMENFFIICDFLDIDPGDFFDSNLRHPSRIRKLLECANKMTETELDSMNVIASAMTDSTK